MQISRNGQGISRSSPFDRWRRGRPVDTPPADPSEPGAPAARIPPAPRWAPNLTVMTSDEIERHLTGLFGRRGYTVWPVPSRGEVASVLLICRGQQGVVVQVRRWNAALGPEVIRAIVAAVDYHTGTLGRLGCSQVGGMVVSTSTFNDEAHALATASGVLLWDRPELEAQIQADLARPGGADPRGGRA